MLSSFRHKNKAAFSLVIIAVLVAAGCSSSGDDTSSGKAAAQMGESQFQLKAPFTEKRPKVRIPEKHTCHGENLSPPLSWVGAPNGTVSYALIAEDLDHAAGTWVHWIVYNIPGNVAELAEGISTSTPELADGTTQGSNDFKNNGYEGPCPLIHVIQWHPVDGDKRLDPAHKYKFSLYALGAELGLDPGASKEELMSAMNGHIFAQADVIGKFQVAPTTVQKQAVGRTINRVVVETVTSTGLSPTPTP